MSMIGSSERIGRGIDFGIDLIMLPFRAAFWILALTLRTVLRIKS